MLQILPIFVVVFEVGRCAHYKTIGLYIAFWYSLVTTRMSIPIFLFPLILVFVVDGALTLRHSNCTVTHKAWN